MEFLAFVIGVEHATTANMGAKTNKGENQMKNEILCNYQ